MHSYFAITEHSKIEIIWPILDIHSWNEMTK